MFKLDENPAPTPEEFSNNAEPHAYVDELSALSSGDAAAFLNVGIDTDENNRAATFILKDHSVVHCKTRQEGVEVLKINQALERYEWLKDYRWRELKPDKDLYTGLADRYPSGGFFIRCTEGTKPAHPVQTCLHLAKEGISQNVHNIVIVEPGADLHIIAGCSTASHLNKGRHIGVSEFYVGRGAT
jgi:uncharacterized protein